MNERTMQIVAAVHLLAVLRHAGQLQRVLPIELALLQQDTPHRVQQPQFGVLPGEQRIVRGPSLQGRREAHRSVRFSVCVQRV